MQFKKISVIIPTYNRRGLIQSCIFSVCSQTYTNLECIVVDDGSTDDTRMLIEELQSIDERIIYLSNGRSKGAQGARNTGILNAKGDWIAFNDSDDEWVPDKLEKQMSIIEQNNYDPYLCVHGNCYVKDHLDNSLYKWGLPTVDSMRPFSTLLIRPSPMLQAILTSKEALKVSGYLDENVPSYQEWDTSISLSRCCKFIHINEPLFIYNKHAGEAMSKDLKKDIEGVHYIRLKYSSEFIKLFGKPQFGESLIENIRRTFYKAYWNYGLLLLSQSKEFIPFWRYLYLSTCLKMHFNPFYYIEQFHRIKRHLFKLFR